MQNNMFLIEETSDGTITFLGNKNDPYKMNWVEGDHTLSLIHI